MLDIVFSDSAWASLLQAQTYGKGKFRGAVSVFLSGESTKKERRRAQREAEEQARRDWEDAVPMDGNSADIYGFDLALSVGDISGETIGGARLAELRRLFSIYPQEAAEAADELLQQAKKNWAELSRRAAGEDVRLWYSQNPDELCGMHWFMSRLEAMDHGAVWVVELPNREKQSWGEVAPGEWSRYLPMQKAVSDTFICSSAACWRQLQQENAPLRGCLNGQLVSLPEDVYDSFILREIQAQPTEFHQASVMGRVLGKYRLGINDKWVALRMERMIENGLLEPVTKPEADSPIYHRMLRKKQAVAPARDL